MKHSLTISGKYYICDTNTTLQLIYSCKLHLDCLYKHCIMYSVGDATNKYFITCFRILNKIYFKPNCNDMIVNPGHIFLKNLKYMTIVTCLSLKFTLNLI